MPVPEHLQSLISKVLAGDTDAIALLAPPVSELVVSVEGTPTPPTAIRVVYYAYTFSSWRELAAEGKWWDRERLSTTRVFDALVSPRSSSSPSSGFVRRSPWQRHWLLLTSVVGTAFYMSRISSETAAKRSSDAAALCYYLLVFASALCGDYSLLPSLSGCSVVARLSSAFIVICATTLRSREGSGWWGAAHSAVLPLTQLILALHGSKLQAALS